jgi:DUF4097 and DUF4098 domain-containing protein YvlB
MEKTFETPGAVGLYVQNEVGLVAVTATRTEETVVWLEAQTPGGEELVERAIVECRPAGRRHMVVVKVPKQGMGSRFIRRNPVTVRVALPEDSDVTVVSGSADIEVTGPVGAADFTTSSGDVTADDVAANLSARSASGDITVGAVDGDLKVQTASGDLRCSSVAGRAVFTTASGDIEVGAADGQVEVKATSGDVRLGELAHGARVTNVSGDVRVLAIDAGALHVRSVSGSVLVGVASGVDLHVDVETMSGEVRSDIPLDDTPRSARRKDASVKLSVRSVSGNVEIERALEQVA